MKENLGLSDKQLEEYKDYDEPVMVFGKRLMLVKLKDGSEAYIDENNRIKFKYPIIYGPVHYNNKLCLFVELNEYYNGYINKYGVLISPPIAR